MANKTIALNTDIHTAHARILQSLLQNNAEITAQDAPNFLAYTLQHSSIWTSFFKIRLDGKVRLEATPEGQTVAQIEINPAKNALLNNVGLQGVIGLVIGGLFLGPLTLLIVPLATAGTYMYLNNSVTDQALGQLSESGPPSGTAPGTSSGVHAATGATSSPALTQLKALGELRDSGVLSSDEFEAKKAELLARI